jgi:hypothetical protein
VPPTLVAMPRTQGTGLVWVSSSAGTTAPSGQVRKLLVQLGEDLVAVGLPLATSRGRRQQATSTTAAHAWAAGSTTAHAVRIVLTAPAR